MRKKQGNRLKLAFHNYSATDFCQIGKGTTFHPFYSPCENVLSKFEESVSVACAPRSYILIVFVTHFPGQL